MSAMVIDGHVADLNVRRAIGPLTHMESAHHDITAQNRHLIHSSPDELDLLFTVNSHVLRILACLDEDGVAFLGGIDRLLKRHEVSCPIERNHKGPRTK